MIRHCLLLVTALGLSGHVNAMEEVIWTGTGRLQPYERIHAQDNTCRLDLNRDGNFVVKRKIRTLDDADDQWVTSWSSGRMREAEYGLELAANGNLEIYDEDEFGFPKVWSTNLVDDFVSNHTLVIDGECRLKLQRNGKEVWENIKIPPFVAGQVLQKGEIFRMSINYNPIGLIVHPFSITYAMYLQHDCNLVQRVGTDHESKHRVWSTGIRRPSTSNCYLYLDKGRVALYEGTFDPTLGFGAIRSNEYWSTPAAWMDTSLITDDVQESYEIVLDGDGTMFHWRSSNDTLPLSA